VNRAIVPPPGFLRHQPADKSPPPSITKSSV
jgi:hypothetical protein